MNYNFKTYKYYTKKGERLTIYGTISEHGLMITILKCSKKDVFKKKSSDIELERLIKEGVLPGIHVEALSTGYAQYYIPILNEKPKNTFLSYCRMNFHRQVEVAVRSYVIKYLCDTDPFIPSVNKL